MQNLTRAYFLDIQLIPKFIESIITVVENSVHVIFDKHNSLSRNVISNDVEEVEQNLEKLDIQPSLNENPQTEEEVQEASSSQ